MRIAIDISTVLNFGTDVGSARYILNLVKNLLEIDKENTYVLFARCISSQNISVLEDIKRQFPDRDLQTNIFRTTQKRLSYWDRFSFPPLEMMGLKADVFHFPDYLIAPILSKNIVLTIHDLSFYRVPQFNFDWFVKRYQKIVKKNALKAKLIIADSSSTKNDIIEYLKIDNDRISVIHLGPDPYFRRLQIQEHDKKVLEDLGIKKKFILSVGTIEPRKNYVNLIKAFDIIRRQQDIECIICGKTGWKSEATFKQHEGSPYRKDIKFIGSVSESQLLQLYNQAELLFYPSYFEGFGLPVVEAMACGLPVVASSTSSILEIVDDKKLLFEPEDVNGFARKIIAILEDKDLKDRLSNRSIENSKKFSFKKTARQTLSSYQKALAL